MGNEPSLCDVCGSVLEGKEPPRGLAHRLDHRHFCAKCLVFYLEPPTPSLPVSESEAPPPRRPR